MRRRDRHGPAGVDTPVPLDGTDALRQVIQCRLARPTACARAGPPGLQDPHLEQSPELPAGQQMMRVAKEGPEGSSRPRHSARSQGLGTGRSATCRWEELVSRSFSISLYRTPGRCRPPSQNRALSGPDQVSASCGLAPRGPVVRQQVAPSAPAGASEETGEVQLPVPLWGGDCLGRVQKP